MQLHYDQKTIECNESLADGLKDYALKVLKEMQETEPGFADCWTACLIEFEELQPEFSWGSIEDINSDDGGIYVELPLPEQAA